MAKSYVTRYEINGVTYNIDWDDLECLNLFITHLDKAIVEKELEVVDSYTNDMDLSEAKNMLRDIGVKV